MPSTNSCVPDPAVFLFVCLLAFLTDYQIASILVLSAHLKLSLAIQILKYESGKILAETFIFKHKMFKFNGNINQYLFL